MHVAYRPSLITWDNINTLVQYVGIKHIDVRIQCKVY